MRSQETGFWSQICCWLCNLGKSTCCLWACDCSPLPPHTHTITSLLGFPSFGPFSRCGCSHRTAVKRSIPGPSRPSDEQKGSRCVPHTPHPAQPPAPTQHCGASENEGGWHGLGVGQGFFSAHMTEEQMCQAARVGGWGSPKWSAGVAAFHLQQQQQRLRLLSEQDGLA